MAQRTEELKREMEHQRQEIGETVDQIQNRVNPKRVTARGKYRVRRWFVDMRDNIMGNQETGYPWEAPLESVTEFGGEVVDKASDVIAGARESMAQAPAKLRRQTQGNPLAAGLIAFGGGMLLASALPKSRIEERAVGHVEQTISNVAAGAAEVGRDVLDEVKDGAGQALDDLEGSVKAAAEEIGGEAREAMERARETTPVQS
jgi:uncharacterized protein YjbJ (UPF0337 family)